jgi:hypothetical protein
VRFWIVRMNAKHFCDQVSEFPCFDFIALCSPGLCIRRCVHQRVH